MGADAVVAPDALHDELRARIPGGADVVVDAVGSLLGTAIEVGRDGRPGRRVRHELQRPSPIHQVEITEKSLTIMGTYISNFTFPEAITLLESGRLNVAPMLSPRVAAGRRVERHGPAALWRGHQGR